VSASILAHAIAKLPMQWNSLYDPDFTVMTHPISPPVVVLVAEDEPLLRMLAVDALTEEGFVTIEAGSATEALALPQATFSSAVRSCLTGRSSFPNPMTCAV